MQSNFQNFIKDFPFVFLFQSVYQISITNCHSQSMLHSPVVFLQFWKHFLLKCHSSKTLEGKYFSLHFQNWLNIFSGRVSVREVAVPNRLCQFSSFSPSPLNTFPQNIDWRRGRLDVEHNPEKKRNVGLSIVSLYDWPTVLQVEIQLLNKDKIYMFCLIQWNIRSAEQWYFPFGSRLKHGAL